MVSRAPEARPFVVEGQSPADRARSAVTAALFALRLPGPRPGESFADLRARAASLLEEYPGPAQRCDGCESRIPAALVSADLKACPICLKAFEEDDEEPSATPTPAQGLEAGFYDEHADDDEDFEVDPTGEVGAPAARKPIGGSEQPEPGPERSAEDEMATTTTTGAAGKGNGKAVTRARPPEVIVPPTAVDQQGVRPPNRTDLENRTRRVLDLKRSYGIASFQLAVELRQIRDQGVYAAGGYKSFEAYVQVECKIEAPWARQLIRASEEYPEDIYAQIGQSQAIRLLALPDKERAKWVERLQETPMSKSELEKAIAGAPRKNKDKSHKAAGRPKVRLMVADLVGRTFEVKTGKDGSGEASLGAGYRLELRPGKGGVTLATFGKK